MKKIEVETISDLLDLPSEILPNNDVQSDKIKIDKTVYGASYVYTYPDNTTHKHVKISE